MKDIVNPSSQVDSTLPLWIRSPDAVITEGVSTVIEGTQVLRKNYRSENHKNFINFMTKALESEERVGFSQDILQNLQKYRDLDTYKDQIVQYGILSVNGRTGEELEIYEPLKTSDDTNILSAQPVGDALKILAGVPLKTKLNLVSKDELDVIELVDGRGFPEENGVILIDDEVILYRRREGKYLMDLERGCSGTTILPTFRDSGKYLRTEPSDHYAGSVVVNLSVLFLVSILDTIHKTYAHNIDSSRVVPEINRSSLLQNIRDFFKAKGTKLGIKALFKFLFAENDVDVFYPGDRMIIPSKSTWDQPLIMRTVQVPDIFCDPDKVYTTPDKVIGSRVEFKSYSATIIKDDNIKVTYQPEDIFAIGQCEYASTYPYLGETQYELYLNKNNLQGDIIVNPTSTLTRPVGSGVDSTNDKNDQTKDQTTITVGSTIGFPDSGVIFIENEGIYYKDKTPNQFLNCIRGYIGVQTDHAKECTVYGPYYVETSVIDEKGQEHYSRSWPLGLVKSVDIDDPGLLHTVNDTIKPNGPGNLDPREQILCRIDKNNNLLNTFRENYNDDLSSQTTTNPDYLTYIENITSGPSGLYFDDEYVFVASSGFPEYRIGGSFGFNTGSNVPENEKLGYNMGTEPSFKVIPRRNIIKDNIIEETESGRKYVFEEKGTDIIGVFIDGVRAFSNVSPVKVTQGKIVKFIINEGGLGYKNPTVVITPSNSTATASVDQKSGSITDIISTSVGNYTDNPKIRISSGENARFQANLDNYGRILSVDVIDGGRYYNDIPSITVSDQSQKGRGALLKCEVLNGSITKVEVIRSGIDYSSVGTSVQAVPVGSGAKVDAIVEYYRYNRPEQIIRNPYWDFDTGNGFVYENPVGADKTLFGYSCSPTQLRTSVQDNGSKHSPILAWAFDGNPIYGPFGYSNGTDDTDGVRRQESSYVKLQNRLTVIPSGGGTTVGSDIPSVFDYPLGVFVEDYKYDPYASAGIDPNPQPTVSEYITDDDDRVITTELDEFLETDTTLLGNLGGDLEDADFLTTDSNVSSDFITTEDDLIIETDVQRVVCFPEPEIPQIPNHILDENNGKICNTPEFPKELYPNGVYAYFITVDSDNITPVFPYIIGKTFNNRPISQRLKVNSRESITALPRIVAYSSILYDDTPLEFDFLKTERYRNPNLSSTKTNLKLEIDRISEGGISGLVIEDSKPLNSKNGDLVYFNNEGTTGTGAQARVSKIQGSEVIASFGSEITTKLISHRQRLDLSNNKDSNGTVKSYIFLPGTFIETVTVGNNGKSRARVISYNKTTHVLELQTTTYRLIQNGDIFYDNKQNQVEVPTFTAPLTAQRSGAGTFSQEDNVTISSIVQPTSRLDSSDLKPGDLWWSLSNGRLYVYFDDNDSEQWVCTQPIGMRPFESASSTSIGTDKVDPSPSVISNTDPYVTISSKSPSERPDGSQNQLGDLWWSSHTGVLYIWNVENPNSYWDPSFGSTAEWVCTDPSGVVPQENNALDSVWPELSGGNNVQTYRSGLRVIISEYAPRSFDTASGCTDLVSGILWWSPSTGKMYIWYENNDDGKWVITNPHGSINSEYSLGFIVGGTPGGGGTDGINDIYGPNAKLPEPSDRKLLWFENLKYFLVGDVIEFELGAPGYDEGNEMAKIQEIQPNNSAIVVRGYEDEKRPGLLPDGTQTINRTRYLYTINTKEPHGLKVGDYVDIENSIYDEVNGRHKVIGGGLTTIAEGTANISNGQVVSVTLTNTGAGYPSNFYVTFSGGGGTGALGLATINPFSGSVEVVTIVNGGSNYTSPPNVYFAPELSNTRFSIYTENQYGDDAGIKYISDSPNIKGPIADFKVTSPGTGYNSLPEVIGVYKKEIDRARTKINLEGGKIISVDVLSSGARYTNPVALFVDNGPGEGATAQVNVSNGNVNSIVMMNSGSGYIDPYLIIVENDGKYVSKTKDIGKIESILISNPGRNISADRSLKPYLNITTRFVLDFTDKSSSSFAPGQLVYQGIGTNKMATAEVVDYDPVRQVIALIDIVGRIKEGEVLYNDLGTEGIVVVNGQSDCKVVVGATATSKGKFIDDTSKVSESYPVIQDSYRYQWFSYLISSPLQKVDYDTFVEKIVHPAGFIRFADVTLHSSVATQLGLVDDSDTIVIDLEICNPIVLLDSSGKSIIAETSEGSEELFVQTDCSPIRCVPENILANGSIPIIASTADGDVELLVQDECMPPANVLRFSTGDSNRFVLELTGRISNTILELNI